MPIIALPKDSRNQPIEVGDIVEYEGEHCEVVGIPDDAAGVVTINTSEGWDDVADFQVTIVPA